MIIPRLAVIDLGTNTFHLLIVRHESGAFVIEDKVQVPVMLGKGAFEENLIQPSAFELGIQALEHFKEHIDKHHVTSVYAFGTAVLRKARNAAAFVDQGSAVLGSPIQVIDGNEEARLIYEGVKLAKAMPTDTNWLIMDIGGGSVEFIIGHQNAMHWCLSLELGATRLKDEFKPTLPLANFDTIFLQTYIDVQIAEVIAACKRYNVKGLIGSSGTFESYASIDYSQKIGESIDLENFESYAISYEFFENIKEVIWGMDLYQLQSLPGLKPFRSELISISTLLVDRVLHHCHIRDIVVSDYSLKEGMISQAMTGNLVVTKIKRNR